MPSRINRERGEIIGQGKEKKQIWTNFTVNHIVLKKSLFIKQLLGFPEARIVSTLPMKFPLKNGDLPGKRVRGEELFGFMQCNQTRVLKTAHSIFGK